MAVVIVMLVSMTLWWYKSCSSPWPRTKPWTPPTKPSEVGFIGCYARVTLGCGSVRSYSVDGGRSADQTRPTCLEAYHGEVLVLLSLDIVCQLHQ